MSAIRVAIVVLCASGCSSPQPRAVEVRPITVRVVDAVTKAPLSDVPIAYVLHTYVSRPSALGIVPNPEGIGQRLAYRARGRTDRRGEATFSGGSLQLRADERLDDEVVLVNLEVDMAHPDARSLLETLRSRCRDIPQTCGGPPDDLEVALDLTHIKSGSAAYRNPAPSHAGKLLVVQEGAAQPGFEDWTQPGDSFTVQFHFSKRGGPEVATVELRPPPSRDARHGRE